jgi:hypothetical protein
MLWGHHAALPLEASHSATDSSVHARVFSPSLMPGGKPSFSIHRSRVVQLRTMPRALRSEKRSNLGNKKASFAGRLLAAYYALVRPGDPSPYPSLGRFLSTPIQLRPRHSQRAHAVLFRPTPQEHSGPGPSRSGKSADHRCPRPRPWHGPAPARQPRA